MRLIIAVICCAHATTAAMIIRPALLARTAAVGGRCSHVELNAVDEEDEDWVKARMAQENWEFSLRDAAAARTRQEAEQRLPEQPAERQGNLQPSSLDAIPAESASVQMMITHRMRYRLSELGYSEAAVDALAPQRAAEIIQAAAAAQSQQQATSGDAQPSEPPPADPNAVNAAHTDLQRALLSLLADSHGLTLPIGFDVLLRAIFERFAWLRAAEGLLGPSNVEMALRELAEAIDREHPGSVQFDARGLLHADEAALRGFQQRLMGGSSGAPPAAAAQEEPKPAQEQAGAGAAFSQSLLEYEARMSEMARATPKTEEEKRAARHQDMLDQIKQADAMDERLKQKQGGWKTDVTQRDNKID